VRRQICHGLEYLGIEWSESANLRGERRISTEDSRIAVEVIATNEQQMIARHSAAFITTGMTRS
jgi:acetate kinase